MLLPMGRPDDTYTLKLISHHKKKEISLMLLQEYTAIVNNNRILETA